MLFLIGFIFELVLDGSLEASKSNKTLKPLRYIILSIIVLFFVIFILMIYLVSFMSLRESLINFITLFLIGTFMLVATIIKLKKEYLTKR